MTTRGAQHFPELDGVRAIALLAVVAGHLLETAPAPPNGLAVARLPALVRLFIDHGWLGVDLFFVLSGFLITGILYRSKGTSKAAYFRKFYARRSARILPLYFLVLGILALSYGWSYAPYFGLCALMSANLWPVTHVAVPAGAAPYWSLAVEEQFYLVWPWLVLWLAPRKLMFAAIAILVAEPVLRLVVHQDRVVTWLHLDGLAVGALVAAWYQNWNGERRQALQLIFGLITAFAAITTAGAPFGLAGAGLASWLLRTTQADLLFGALVATAVSFTGAPWLWPLRTRFAVVTALLSYCIYLIHRPLVDAYQNVLGSLPWISALAPVPATYLRAVVVLLCAYALAAISRRYFELPFLRLARGQDQALPPNPAGTTRAYRVADTGP